MAKQIHDGTTAKAFHWTIVALLIVQYPLGWFIPHIHRGMKSVAVIVETPENTNVGPVRLHSACLTGDS
jgi:cytochrome b561